MARKVKHRNYYLGFNGEHGRWELTLKYGDEEETHLVARAVDGEDKDDFESICRKYVSEHSPAALRELPRQLFIRNLKGMIVESPAYDLR